MRGVPVLGVIFLVVIASAHSGAAATTSSTIEVSHNPKQPKSGERVTISVKMSSAVKADDFVLQYQVVEPGKYIDVEDPDYSTEWKDLPLSTAGPKNADKEAAIFTVELKPELQRNRRLIRYRIWSTEGKTVVAPTEDDTQPNFAYFVYDGIPEWRAAINPKGSGIERKVVTFKAGAMRSVQAYHLISKKVSIENTTWFEPKNFMSPSASEYRYTGTLVADGKVYDHVRFRARGGTWRHAMGKNMWKIDFPKGHHFEARDNWGRKYEKKWSKLNLNPCIQQGDYGMRGEQGMLEAITFKLFNLAGVESPHTHWVQLRIVDEAEEAPANQYEGDFWGLYLVVENVDDDYLEEHHLPDGNLYKMDFSGPELKHSAEGFSSDGSDVHQFMSDMRRQPDARWWTANVDLPRYYSYRSILECVHHYDLDMGKNYYFFHDVRARRWQVIPWDVDLTWSDRMFGMGMEPFLRAGLLGCEPLRIEYDSRLTEIRDLLFNSEQTGALIDEYAAVISQPDGSPSMAEADRAKWDYHPIMSSQYTVRGKTAPGLFYQSSPTRDFQGMTELMKRYVEKRGQWVDRMLLGHAPLPATPVIATGSRADFSAPKLKVRLARPTSAAKVKWRVAEVSVNKKDRTEETVPGAYEINTLWETMGGAEADIPTEILKAGHTYRVRARVQGRDGRWSHWSAPMEAKPPP